MLKMGKVLKDLISDYMRPVGSYYETSNVNFNPNGEWYGTWVEDTAGRVIVALDTNQIEFDTVGKLIGSKYSEKHYHKILQKNASGIGGFPVVGQYAPVGGQAIVIEEQGSYVANYENSLKWQLYTDDAGTGDGGNIPPSIVAKRWHRTA